MEKYLQKQITVVLEKEIILNKALNSLCEIFETLDINSLSEDHKMNYVKYIKISMI